MPRADASISIAQIIPPGPFIIADLIADTKVSQSSGGTTGWQVKPRPRRKATTQWFGTAPWQMDLSILLDNDMDPAHPFGRDTVDINCYILEAWLSPPPGGIAPAVLRIDGPVPYLNRWWVLQALAWDDANGVIRDARGERTQQAATLSLLEYIPADINITPVVPSPAAVARKVVVPQRTVGIIRPAPATRRYTVVRGDTLFGIAGRLLGNHALWPEIARLNHLRDPNRIFPGQVLAIP